MKITKSEFEILKKDCDAVIELYGKNSIIEMYESGNYPNSDKVKDPQLRMCFDIFYLALRFSANRFELEQIINKYNCDHLYTALKKICPTLTNK